MKRIELRSAAAPDPDNTRKDRPAVSAHRRWRAHYAAADHGFHLKLNELCMTLISF